MLTTSEPSGDSRRGSMLLWLVLSIFLQLLLGAPTTAAAQSLVDGFVRGDGNADVAFSVSFQRFSSLWMGTAKTDTPPELGEVTTMGYNFFASIGLGRSIDLVLALPYLTAEASGAMAPPAQAAFQDLSVYGKWRPMDLRTERMGDSSLSLLLAAGLRLPVGEYLSDAAVAIGHRAHAVDGRLVLQYRWDVGPFLALQSGFTWRSGITPASVPVFAQVGYAGQRAYAAAWLDYRDAISGTDIGQGPFQGNAVSATILGGSVFVPVVAGFGLTATGSGVLDGRNIGAAYQVSGGVVYQIRPEAQ